MPFQFLMLQCSRMGIETQRLRAFFESSQARPNFVTHLMYAINSVHNRHQRWYTMYFVREFQVKTVSGRTTLTASALQKPRLIRSLKTHVKLPTATEYANVQVQSETPLCSFVRIGLNQTSKVAVTATRYNVRYYVGHKKRC